MVEKVIGHHIPGFGKANKAIASPCGEEDHIDAFIGKRGVETLRELSSNRKAPFFAWISFCGPHDPYDPPAPYDTMFDPARMPLPRRAPGELDHLPPIVRERTSAFGIEKLRLWGVPDAEIQRVRALYYGNLALIDTWIGHLLEVLKQNRLENNTLVVFTSDHGDCLGDHDLFWKSFLPCDADMRVPLLMRWPGKAAEGVREDFATGADLMPTILAAAGVPIPKQCHGRDLLAARKDCNHAIMFSEPNKWRYRDKRWAYTWWPDQPFDTLYDLTKDRDELRNLCHDRAKPPPETVRLRRKIGEWLKWSTWRAIR